MAPMRALTRMRTLTYVCGLAAVVLATASCGDVIRQGQSPVYLTVDALLASRGGGSNSAFTSPLLSDVITNVTSPAPCSPQSPCPTVFNDTGQVVLRLAPKDIAIAPTSNNTVTITRYRVKFTRSDGRNTPGLDVPYGFDGAVTGTVPANGTIALNFELVRHVMKYESPLAQLANSPSVITTIAEVTFFGQDQVGNGVAVSGLIQVNFGNFGDF